MKTKGIVRSSDELGRVVVPMEIRKELNWGKHEPVEISVFGDYVLLRSKNHPKRKEKTISTDNPLVKDIENKLRSLDSDELLCIQTLLSFMVRKDPHEAAESN